MPPALPPVSTACRERLTAHYGPALSAWIDAVPELLTMVARRWELTPTAYHDAGHASVIATATAPDGRCVLLKAWPDAERFRKEVAALRLWSPGPVAEVIEVADDAAVAALALVGDRPGGRSRAGDDTVRAAATIQHVHNIGRTEGEKNGFPRLADYLREEIRPCVERRSHLARAHGFSEQLRSGISALEKVAECAERTTLLHADLYQENTVCDDSAQVFLIDPLPMVGDAVFDWAFWSVYYAFGQDTEHRVRLASQTSGCPAAELLPWCLALGIHGLLFYLEVGDPRVPRMAEVILSLARLEERNCH